MMRLLGKTQSRYMAFLHDLLMIPLAWLGSYWLRFNLDGIPIEFGSDCARLQTARLFHRARIVAPVGEHIPCKILM